MAMARTRPTDVEEVALKVPPEKDNPEPIVTAEIAVPLPCSTPVTLVERVSAGVPPPLLVPANPLAVATEIAVTPVAGAVLETHVVPFDVSTLPFAPGATT